MHLLYLDDSGSVANAADRHIILAGLAVFERQSHWLGKSLDELAQQVSADDPQGLEFHGVDIFAGRKRWRRLGREARGQAFHDALDVLAKSHHARLFGAVVHQASVSPEDPMELAFEQICMRFDRYLGRLHASGDTQRGLIILDKSSYETSLQGLTRDFRLNGHRWGQLYNLADVPFFVDSKATRLIQFADLIAYSLRRYYEHGDSTYVDRIAHRFDRSGPALHGLVHVKAPDAACNCLACRNR